MRDRLPVWVDVRSLRPGQQLHGHVDLAELSRWPSTDGGGSVRLELEIAQADSGRLCLRGSLQGETLTPCQRCLEMMPLPFAADFLLEVVEDEEQARHVPDEVDLYVVEDGRVKLHDLVCDEALLALPMMARHEPGQCEPPDARKNH